MNILHEDGYFPIGNTALQELLILDEQTIWALTSENICK